MIADFTPYIFCAWHRFHRAIGVTARFAFDGLFVVGSLCASSRTYLNMLTRACPTIHHLGR